MIKVRVRWYVLVCCIYTSKENNFKIIICKIEDVGLFMKIKNVRKQEMVTKI